MHDDAFAHAVRERRHALDMTQVKLARLVGCATITLKRIEGGTLRPSREMAARILRVLEVPPAERDHLLDLVRRRHEHAARNPYKGLLAFGEADAADFFGREALVARLAERLTGAASHARSIGAPATPSAGRFLALIGPSGSGKSSVARAGLIPALRAAQPNPARWRSLAITPGAQPLAALDLALRGDNDLLLIDQLEELWALCPREDEQAAFLGRLAALAGAAHGPVLAVTLRADFYDRPLRHSGFGALLRDHTEVLLPLTPDQIARAVAGPAERAGVGVEAELLAACVADAERRPGALPLLQYALTELFERRANGSLTLAAYRAVGGVGGALTHRAEELFDGLGASERELARQLFMRLVQPGEDGPDTRRRAALGELPSGAAGVAELFARHRLLTLDGAPGAATVELAHEAMLGGWDRLRGWLEAHRDDMRAHRRLAQAAAEWAAAGRDASFLARGARLAQFEAIGDLALNDSERAFVVASAAERERIAAEERARQEAMREALAQSEARRLASEALKLVREGGNAELIALLALRSLDLRYTPQGDEALCAAATLAYPERIYPCPGYGLSISPDGASVAIGGFEICFRLFDIASGAELRVFEGAHTDLVNYVCFSPNGRTIASCATDGRAQVWDAATGAPLTAMVGHTGDVRAMCMSHDGRLLLTCATDSSWRLWDVATGAELRQVIGHHHPFAAATFVPDAPTTAISLTDGVVREWDVLNGAELRRLSGDTSRVLSLALSPDGALIATGGEDRSVRLWDRWSGAELRCLNGHNHAAVWCAFSPDGALLATCGDDGAVWLWEVASGRMLRRYAGHTAFTFAVAFTPDGRRLISASGDGTSRLWQVDAPAQVLRYAGALAVFSPDGGTIATALLDGSVRLWDRRSGACVRELGRHDMSVLGIAFTADGSRVITASADTTVRVWDTAGGRAPLALAGHTHNVRKVCATRDGRLLLSSSDDWSARLWDAATGALVRELRHASQVFDAAFSPDEALIVTGSIDGTARIWDAHTGAALRVIPAGASSVAWGAGGATILTGDWAGVIHMWDAASGERIGELLGHTTVIWMLRASADGRLLLSASGDQTARLWDMAARRELRRFAGHAGSLNSAELSPDGRSVLTGSSDGAARLWDVDLELTRGYVRGKLLRDFSELERAQYGIAGAAAPG